MKRALAASVVLTAFVAGCITVSGPGLPPDVSRRTEQAQEAKRKAKKYKDIYEAWDDAVDNISTDDERGIGQAASILVLNHFDGMVLTDVELLRYVNSVGNAVALQGDRGKKATRSVGRRFFFGILEDDAPNAVSLPGGHVFVTTGLLRRLDSESELAFVLGHEIAHVDLEHGLIALKGAVGFDGALKEAMNQQFNASDFGTTSLFKNTKIFDRAALVLFDGFAGKANFLSAAQEEKADKLGVTYAARAGYEAAAANRVLAMLGERGGKARSRSHGSPDDRMKALEKTIAEATKDDAKTGFTRWQTQGLARVEALVGGSGGGGTE